MNGWTEVWKYELPDESVVLQMPEGAEVVAVHEQRNVICIWAQVNPEARRTARTFRVVGTGHRVDDADRLRYIGTAYIASFVLHVYEQDAFAPEEA